MEITITARHTEISNRFREHVKSKLEKVSQLAPRTQRIDVHIDHENNPRQAANAERIEITVHDKPVIRAEASADELHAALDLAQDKLMERLRRTRDRRKPHHVNARGRVRAERDKRAAQELIAMQEAAASATKEGDEPDYGDSPVVIREKVHEARPMSVDDALYEMELIGHDFYLFHDVDTGHPSVIYRRKGWSYGVIRLSDTEQGVADGEVEQALAG